MEIDNIQEIRKAQDVAERLANFHSREVTLAEIYSALVTLANFAEDVLFEKQKEGKNE